jgi:S-adenosylmethionine hydrolase
LSIIGLSAIEKIVVLPELAPEKKCFPEKYLLAPVAARLAMGEPIESVGVVRETFVTKIAKQTFVSGGDLRGSVVAIDHYGNLITDIDQTSFISFVGNEKFIINFGREKITRLSYQYTEVDFGDCLVMFNSAGLLEIAIRYGNAAELLGLGYGNAVIVSKVTG